MPKQFQRIVSGLSTKHRLAALVVAAVIVMGGIFLFTSHAATPFVSNEAENGTLTGSATAVNDSTASGGKAINFGGSTSTNTGFLPFTMPSQSALKNSNKLVFAHYFAPYPKSMDNKPAASDYYQTVYMNPDTAAFSAYGGLMRQRPLPQPVGGASWQLDNMKTEVKQASNAGLDGFTIDILGIQGSNWDNQAILMQAAHAVDPNFKIVLMPDSNGSGVATGIDSFAAAVASIANNPSVYHLPDGRLVVSPFYPENSKTGATWWKSWIDLMKSKYNISVAFVPCFLNFSTANQAAFAPFSYGYSNWGNRSPTGQTSIPSYITRSHAEGKIWMQPVSMQDIRPNQHYYTEADNTENLRATWQGAAGGADWVQVPTWNDYSEAAEISPSSHTGWSPLDISSYFLNIFKFGSAPSINKDVLYLSHRVQFAAATPNAQSKETSLMTLMPGSATPRDTVEVLSFLKAPATITVKIGSTTQSYDAPAGMYAKLYPLQLGSVSASAVRSGSNIASVDSPFPVVSSFLVQDEQYHVLSSARAGGIGNWNDGF